MSTQHHIAKKKSIRVLTGGKTLTVEKGAVAPSQSSATCGGCRIECQIPREITSNS